MALELKQSLRLSQQLVMTPQLQQAIQAPAAVRLELVDLIRSEMEQNPLLEEPQDGAEAELTRPGGAGLHAEREHRGERARCAHPRGGPAGSAGARRGRRQARGHRLERYLDNYQTQHTAPSGGGSIPRISLRSRARSPGRRPGRAPDGAARMAALAARGAHRGVIIGNLNRDGYLVLDPDVRPDGRPSTPARWIPTSRSKCRRSLPRRCKRCGASRKRRSRSPRPIR